jgi:hypothetical protein
MSDVQFAFIRNQICDSARFPGVRMIRTEVRERFPADFQKFADPILLQSRRRLHGFAPHVASIF